MSRYAHSYTDEVADLLAPKAEPYRYTLLGVLTPLLHDLVIVALAVTAIGGLLLTVPYR